ncbi:Phosphoglycerate mutase [Sulfitobacter noctilucicola]|uniref:Putative phosphoglycerate mutase n=1 Tax=Sulfitobacter noctilucicola TaxID=1342301 RepID=A0A7W6MBC7_9RHOB|nr:histidine phosphatase family protein [Sulfitobacter noctilucicola]KIN66392.1 Phosphoglycerate mutase [Sulfitobacter noctilucicola]MBB4175741.1 putative phosphoglycerate mutase [Sulfitobacter noctilucicola]
MPQYPKIWFLRHGQTEWNRLYRMQGQLDSPLTDQGLADARRQAKIISPVLNETPQIFVSPLGRTIQTAEIALRGAAYQTDPRLMEIDAGLWQGRFRDEILLANPELAKTQKSALEIYDAAPEGEGIAALQARVIDFLTDLTGPSVVIAHGLLGQVLRAHVRGIAMEKAGHLSNDQGCVYVLENWAETRLDELS